MGWGKTAPTDRNSNGGVREGGGGGGPGESLGHARHQPKVSQKCASCLGREARVSYFI